MLLFGTLLVVIMVPPVIMVPVHAAVPWAIVPITLFGFAGGGVRPLGVTLGFPD